MTIMYLLVDFYHIQPFLPFYNFVTHIIKGCFPIVLIF